MSRLDDRDNVCLLVRVKRDTICARHSKLSCVVVSTDARRPLYNHGAQNWRMVAHCSSLYENAYSIRSEVYRASGRLSDVDRIQKWMRRVERKLSEVEDFAGVKAQDYADTIYHLALAFQIEDVRVETHDGYLLRCCLSTIRSVVRHLERQEVAWCHNRNTTTSEAIR